jgi:hypothetical protein
MGCAFAGPRRDTVFRGALKFSSEGGLVVAIHGGAGSGKTTLSLALGAYLAPFGIDTFFITAEEHEGDLRNRANSICPEAYKRLSFFPSNSREWLFVQRVPTKSLEAGDELHRTIERLKTASGKLADLDELSGALRPCQWVVVLDGIHDLLSFTAHDTTATLRQFIADCRELHALVIMTTGEEWAGDVRIDYLVDLALRLTNAATEDYGRKPDRRLLLTKARFQLVATGTHGFQIAGDKGVRLSPQINYQLDRRAIWKARLPDFDAIKVVMRLEAAGTKMSLSDKSVNIPRGSNIFINGIGSGGKAALALKLAMAPLYRAEGFQAGVTRGQNRKRFLDPTALIWERENILIVSFLYATEYYRRIFERLRTLRSSESPLGVSDLSPYYEVIQLYPGYLKPNDLFNRIEWRLREAEIDGMPFTSVIIEGIHNVFLQFPELQVYPVFWPQLFSMLRSRPLTTITTNTYMDLSFRGWSASSSEQDKELAPKLSGQQPDDRSSEPLRHALRQQTDFSFDVLPRAENRNEFYVGGKSAINQSIPKDPMIWSRERLVFTDAHAEQPKFL